MSRGSVLKSAASYLARSPAAPRAPRAGVRAPRRSTLCSGRQTGSISSRVFKNRSERTRRLLLALRMETGSRVLSVLAVVCAAACDGRAIRTAVDAGTELDAAPFAVTPGESALDRTEAAQARVAVVVCACFGGSPEEIEACHTRVGSAERVDCYRAIGEEVRLQPALQCFAETTETYADCLESIEVASDRCTGTAAQECNAAVQAAYAACPPIPPDLAEAWYDCG